jgi:hypothetical protein
VIVLKLIELAASCVWWVTLFRVFWRNDRRYVAVHYALSAVFAVQSIIAGSAWSLLIYLVSCLAVDLHGRIQQMMREIAALHEVRTAINQEYNP